MGRISKAFAILLTLIVAVSGMTLLTSNPECVRATPIPSVSIVYPTDTTVFNVSIEGVFLQVLYQTSDKLSWVGFSINGGANVTCTGNVTDTNAFINDSYQFDFGHPTLTLYANDTAGNWAIPQTVTYTAYFYADSYYAPSSVPASASSTPTPAVPELSGLASVLLLLSMFSVAVLLRHRYQGKKF